MSTQGLGALIYPLSKAVKDQVRFIERCSFKLTKQKCSKIFNITCLNENILPK